MGHLSDMNSNPVALVTGAGKGIGRATALKLAEEGFRIAAFSRTEADLESLQSQVEGGDENCFIFTGDVGDEDAVNRCIEQVGSQWRRIDLLVNNAGFGISAPVHELRVEHWDSMMSANLRGTFLFTRAVVPGMIERQDGMIINVASIAGKQGFVGGAGYAASKHAVMGFTDSLWRELREHNIRVCAVCPGSVDTHFFGSDVGGEGREHMMRPDDVAEAIVYIARQPDRMFIKEIELRVTHPRKN